MSLDVFYREKEVVVTTSLSEKKLLTTEKVTTSDDLHKHTDRIATIEEVLNGTYEVHRRL